LLEGIATHDLARAFVVDAEYHLSAAAVRQGTAAASRFIEVEAGFRFFELVLLALFGVQQLFNRLNFARTRSPSRSLAPSNRLNSVWLYLDSAEIVCRIAANTTFQIRQTMFAEPESTYR
jgi:hypothetical protein